MYLTSSSRRRASGRKEAPVALVWSASACVETDTAARGHSPAAGSGRWAATEESLQRSGRRYGGLERHQRAGRSPGVSPTIRARSVTCPCRDRARSEPRPHNRASAPRTAKVYPVPRRGVSSVAARVSAVPFHLGAAPERWRACRWPADLTRASRSAMAMRVAALRVECREAAADDLGGGDAEGAGVALGG